jgi:hypothetical protein
VVSGKRLGVGRFFGKKHEGVILAFRLNAVANRQDRTTRGASKMKSDVRHLSIAVVELGHLLSDMLVEIVWLLKKLANEITARVHHYRFMELVHLRRREFTDKKGAGLCESNG